MICIFCGLEFTEKEYPIPVAQIHFQPVRARGQSDDILQGKYSCTDCHAKILGNAAKAAKEDGKAMIEGHAH